MYHRLMSLLLLTLVLSLEVAAQTSQLFDFSATRPSSQNVNTIRLTCSDLNSGAVITDSVTFLNNSVVELPNAQRLTNGSLLFVINRTLEGSYACGRTGFNKQISNSVTLVALPKPTQFGDTTFFATSGSRARLDCAITPGVLISQYFVTWRNASNHSVVFFRTFAPGRSREPIQLDPRYTLDFSNFSLFISGVSTEDGTGAGNHYQCVLGVENPLDLGDEVIYTQTETTNIELLIFEAPSFVEQPSSVIVTNASATSFNCSTVSSPNSAIISWKHGEDNIIIRNTTKYTLSMPRTNPTSEGVVAFSVLTVHDLNGFDSGIVECRAEYIERGMSVVMETAKATLSVLDELAQLVPISLDSGGFVFTIEVKAPLLIGTRLKIVYTNAEDMTLVTSRLSKASYFNTTETNYIAFSDEVPYDRFLVKAGLVHENIEGLLFGDDNVYKRASPFPFQYGFWILLSLLVILIMLVLIVLVILLTSHYTKRRRIKERNMSGVIDAFQSVGTMNMNVKKDNRHCNNCCVINVNSDIRNVSQEDRVVPDDSKQVKSKTVSKNSFTVELANKFVEAVEKAVYFGLGDDVIKPNLQASLKQWAGSTGSTSTGEYSE